MNDNLYEDFDCNVKLGSVFALINGIDLPISKFDLPVSIYNSLYKSGITDLQQILTMSANELMSTIVGSEGRKQNTFFYLMDMLEDFNTNGIPE